MSETPRDRANRAQLAASDPAVSAFVAASAGSGKTKLLTDRLLRLMLAGARPERIQCLTFTKAAAAEMALRLQRTLGRWVTLPQPALAEELRRLNVDPTEEACRGARALFARVLDLPGGMRIGTIHAFSQSLLRRFPLEAAISPHFQLVDDRDAEDAMTEAREQMLARASDAAMRAALQATAGLCSAEQFGRHVATLHTDRARLDRALGLGAGLLGAQRRALGCAGQDEASIIADGVQWMAEHALREAVLNVQAQGPKAAADRAGRILDWLSLGPADRAENWEAWRCEFFTKAGEKCSARTLVGQKIADSRPEWWSAYEAEADRIQRIDDDRRALQVASVSHALATLAWPVVQGYSTHKTDSGLLDYDDLIGRTAALLVDPGAAWVLYKLDGGIDHLLLDEVQDTAPQQWGIAHALTEEFFAGAGARETIRTVFAVGDRKQSIYSFQGADTTEFDRSRARLARRVRESGQVWQDSGLDVSFRSTAPVLGLVDAVFASPIAAAGVADDGQALTHYANREGHAGQVELWPLTPLPTAAEPKPWTIPAENQGLTSAAQILADTLAAWIRDQTGGSVMLESRGRPLAPGDVMVLVRRRDAFARVLVRALKARGVPVAGLDRLVLTEQPAVQDLMALGDALLLPQDDLTFACVLTSPLGGLNDDDLMALAVGRPAPLWEVLRDRAQEQPHWRRAWDFFAPLLARVDYASPFALFAEALGSLGGRARLFARLGPEAAEPVDEFLNAALTYARIHPPSLQGFLHWLRRSGAEVKREPEAAGGQVRVMTVHGAKGLQAPLVILPDTTALPPDEGGILWADDPATGIAVPLWSPRREVRCRTVDTLRDVMRRRRMEEHNRLLYVALTRAEDRLLVCGRSSKRDLEDTCWYRLVERGFAALAEAGAYAPVRTPFAAWPGEVLSLRSEQTVPAEPDRASVQIAGAISVPAWLGTAPDWRPAPPPPEPPRSRPLAPSRPEGVELGPVPAAVSPLAERDVSGNRFRRGQLIHALLQHLPALPAATWREAAARFVDRPGHGLSAADARGVVDEVLAILTHADLAALFGPDGRAEVPLTGVVGDVVVGGLVDRLAVLPDRVLLADFKTNRRPPARAEDTPVLYLRQMATYRSVLRAIYPERPVRCALIWTRDARVSILPDAMLDAHEPGRSAEVA
ncbi:MAG: double-strand break repair helicase AddA [Acetobacteraceae bacterium]